MQNHRIPKQVRANKTMSQHQPKMPMCSETLRIICCMEPRVQKENTCTTAASDVLIVQTEATAAALDTDDIGGHVVEDPIGGPVIRPSAKFSRILHVGGSPLCRSCAKCRKTVVEDFTHVRADGLCNLCHKIAVVPYSPLQATLHSCQPLLALGYLATRNHKSAKCNMKHCGLLGFTDTQAQGR